MEEKVEMFPVYYRVQEPSGQPRLETVYQDDAVRYAQEIFRRERTMCDVLEVPRP